MSDPFKKEDIEESLQSARYQDEIASEFRQNAMRIEEEGMLDMFVEDEEEDEEDMAERLALWESRQEQRERDIQAEQREARRNQSIADLRRSSAEFMRRRVEVARAVESIRVLSIVDKGKPNRLNPDVIKQILKKTFPADIINDAIAYIRAGNR